MLGSERAVRAKERPPIHPGNSLAPRKLSSQHEVRPARPRGQLGVGLWSDFVLRWPAPLRAKIASAGAKPANRHLISKGTPYDSTLPISGVAAVGSSSSASSGNAVSVSGGSSRGGVTSRAGVIIFLASLIAASRALVSTTSTFFSSALR